MAPWKPRPKPPPKTGTKCSQCKDGIVKDKIDGRWVERQCKNCNGMGRIG